MKRHAATGGGSRMSEQVEKHRPDWLELERIVLLDEAERITSLSSDTLKRRYPSCIVKLSPRRVGMKLRHVLAISSGERPS
jgi:hypothetical protein